MLQVLAHFAVLDDPRAANARHELSEIMFIAIAATLAGAKTCVEMAEFGEAKQTLLRKVLELPHGIPSHDTFSTVFRTLDPAAFAEIFAGFATAFGTAIGQDDVVAVDGKAMKRAYEKGQQSAPRMMVTAWGAEARMSLAARPVVKGDETNAAIAMLANLDIEGAIITGDALHCNRKMAQTIIDGGADYVLPIKGNQDSLLSDARAKFGAAKKPPTAKTHDEDHGRVETRRAVVVAAGDLGEYHEFPGLKAIGMIEATRSVDGKTQTFVHYFAMSRRFRPAELLRIKREHWGIENRLHWQLDVVLDEDMSRTRKDNGPENLAMLRRLALNIARADKSKGSLAGKLRKAAWNDEALVKMLSQMR
jgi:predicted transposase YbfD/YdcC